MEPFEDRPNLYEDQFSQFIRKEPADGEKVCVCVYWGERDQDFQTQHYTCDLAAPTVCSRWHTQFVLMIVCRVVIK